MMVNQPLLLLGVLAFSQIIHAAEVKPAGDQLPAAPQTLVIPKFQSLVKIDGNLRESP